MDPPWPAPLSKRWGGEARLLGLRVYHDFPWDQYFPDERTQFRGGLSLAKFATQECQPGKRPALLLTSDPKAPEHSIETDEECVVVVRLPEYLELAGPDPAAAYYARRVGRGIANLVRLRDLAASPEAVAALLESAAGVEAVASWARSHPDRLASLQAAISTTDGDASRDSWGGVADVVSVLSTLDAETWRELLSRIPQMLDGGQRQLLASALTNDEQGRVTVSRILASRVTERIEDIRRSADGYTQLLESASATETDLQEYIQRHPWIVGLDYVEVRPKLTITRGALDFVLERYDGFHDVLELKSPRDPIITPALPPSAPPPPPSEYAVSKDLANALAQVHAYRDTLTTGEAEVQRLFGLKYTRNPRLFIIIGMTNRLSEDRLRVLQQLNLSLTRVEIIPYDILGRRATGWLANLERHLSLSDERPASGGAGGQAGGDPLADL